MLVCLKLEKVTPWTLSGPESGLRRPPKLVTQANGFYDYMLHKGEGGAVELVKANFWMEKVTLVIHKESAEPISLVTSMFTIK